jgi:hypothetical protein
VVGQLAAVDADQPQQLPSDLLMAREQLWVVSPVYMDVESFLVLRGEVLAQLDGSEELRHLLITFVVLDDSAGVDPEVERLRNLDDVRVVQPPFNLGHQRGIVYAVRMTSAAMSEDDIVVTMDSDGEDRPEDMPKLLASLLAVPGDTRRLVLARRTRRREPPVFKVMYLLFRLLFRVLTGVVVRTGNYAAYRGWLAQNVLRHPHFDLCYSSTLVSLPLAPEQVPCPRGERYAGRSRMGYSALMLHGMRMLMPFTDRIALRALTGFSVVFVVGVVAALAVLAVRLFSPLAIPGWATSTLLLMLVLSFAALGNFIVLFAVFSQSRGLALANIEHTDGSSGRPSPPPD